MLRPPFSELREWFGDGGVVKKGNEPEEEKGVGVGGGGDCGGKTTRDGETGKRDTVHTERERERESCLQLLDKIALLLSDISTSLTPTSCLSRVHTHTHTHTLYKQPLVPYRHPLLIMYRVNYKLTN